MLLKIRSKAWIPAFAGMTMGVLLSGCSLFHAHNPPDPRPDNADSEIRRTERPILDVPFYANNSDQCGPSALASVLAFWGIPTDPSTLKKEIYLAHLKGSLSIDLLLAAENRGFKAHLYNGSIDNLKSELDKGHPLVAFINRGFDFLPVGHYVVINGYDESRHGLYIHSSMSKNKFVSFKSFLKYWDKTERSTLLVLPPELDNESIHAEM